MMQAGEFSPTQHSKLTYNEAFRANQFVGAGIRPIYRLNQMFHLRGEFYGFMPIYPIERNSLNKAYYGKAFSKFEYLGENICCVSITIRDISAYVKAKQEILGDQLSGRVFVIQIHASGFSNLRHLVRGSND